MTWTLTVPEQVKKDDDGIGNTVLEGLRKLPVLLPPSTLLLLLVDNNWLIDGQLQVFTVKTGDWLHTEADGMTSLQCGSGKQKDYEFRIIGSGALSLNNIREFTQLRRQWQWKRGLKIKKVCSLENFIASSWTYQFVKCTRFLLRMNSEGLFLRTIQTLWE